MAGYSSTPLWKKLGYATDTPAWVVGAPAGYQQLLQLPREFKVTWRQQPEPDMKFVHVFAREALELKKHLTSLRRMIAPNGVVWVSWPKKTSGVATDITEDTIRQHCLPLGFVDIKVCAVDETWSGLKLMIRKGER